ncbi:hypothetical protein [Rhodopseudomonas sp.]
MSQAAFWSILSGIQVIAPAASARYMVRRGAGFRVSGGFGPKILRAQE